MAAIITDKLVHVYRHHIWDKPKTALRGLCLQVEEGEIFGYLGSNGAGKTTTIKILVGLQRSTDGTASVFGTDVRNIDARRAIGFLPENPYFYEYLSARETMHYYAALCDVPRAERAKRCDELLEFMGITDAADVRVRDFSKGMRQRLGIAQALVHKPKLVILDEPMSGLDPVGRRLVRDAIVSLREQKMTVFFSSHILADVEMICDRVGLLQGGVLEACGPLSELLQTKDKGVEVQARTVSDSCRTALEPTARSVRIDGERVSFLFDTPAAAQQAVATLDKDGAQLLLFQPVRETLEEYFMRSTGKSRAEVGAWSGGADK